MEIKRSKIQQEAFVLLDTNISLIFPNESQTQDIDKFEIDYHIFTNNLDEYLVRIIFELKATRHKMNQSGLHIDLQASCDFRIDSSIEIGSENYTALIRDSATVIAYDNIRAYLQNISSYYPIEPYILPVIDLQDLYRKYLEDFKNE